MSEMTTTETELAGRRAVVMGDAGPVVVLLHPLGADRTFWAGQQRLLADRFRTVAVDVTPITGDTDDLLAGGRHIIEAAAKELDAERVHVIGLSMGGQVACRAALAVPERVAGLVLLSTKLVAEQPGAIAAFDDFANAIEAMGATPDLVGLLAGGLFRRSLPDFEAVTAEWVERLTRFDPAVLAGAIRAVARRDEVIDALARAPFPLRCVYGDEDQLMNSGDVAQTLSQAGITADVVNGVGHFMTLEEPERVAALVRAALDAAES
jgi:pimeloyl-ACP methyl ester carboxylesterase